ncbi:LuxR C-terminal-related transcriptional regulator [Lachnospiraceae bacterium 45-P1]
MEEYKKNRKQRKSKINWKQYENADRTLLSERQNYILNAAIDGKTRREIAEELGTNTKNICASLTRIRYKLDGRDEEFKARARAWANERYHGDPEFRKRHIEHQKKYQEKLNPIAEKERREYMRNYVRDYYHKHPEQFGRVDRNITKKINHYRVSIYANNKLTYIGSYASITDAVAVRDMAETQRDAGNFSVWFEQFKKNGRKLRGGE